MPFNTHASPDHHFDFITFIRQVLSPCPKWARHNLCQWRCERQLPARAANRHVLGVIRNNPILACRIPIRDIAPRNVDVECSSLIRLDRQPLKSAQLKLRIVRAT